MNGVRDYGCIVYHLLGKNRKVWGTKLILQPCPEHYVFVSVPVVSQIVIVFCSLVLEGSQYKGSQNS